MSSSEHILVSLEPRFANSIFDGVKKVELRRRRMNVSVGAVMWIYAKQPVGSIMGHVKIDAVHALSPETLWSRFGDQSALCRAEFFEYFSGVPVGVALTLTDCRKLRRSVSLKELRKTASGFQPPQFFSRLHSGNPVRKVIVDAA